MSLSVHKLQRYSLQKVKMYKKALLPLRKQGFELVEMRRIELLTYALRTRRSPS